MRFPFVDNACLQCGIAFAQSMLEPHARSDASMTHGQIQAAFVLLGAVYMLASPVCGQVCFQLPARSISARLCTTMCWTCGFWAAQNMPVGNTIWLFFFQTD